MQSKSILLLLLGTSLFFTSCKKTEEAPASTESKTETTATEKPAANDVSNITTTPAPAATQTATPAGQPPKLNPPHGQPFHRCEIAVGAPLDGSAPAQGQGATPPPAPAQQNAPKSFFKTVQSQQQSSSTQPVATAPQPTTQTVQPKPTPTPAQTTAKADGPRPKNNPPHGQPHHRCDIKVGDPLPDA
jgi:hypothetical protein